MSIKDVFNSSKNARMNAQLRRSNKIKNGIVAGLGTTTAVGAFSTWFFTRREAKKSKDKDAKIDELAQQMNDQAAEMQKQNSALRAEIEELKKDKDSEKNEKKPEEKPEENDEVPAEDQN